MMIDSIAAPRWVLEEYEGAERDFADWMYEVVYASRVTEVQDKEGAQRLMAQVRARVMERTDELKGLMNRSEVYQMWKAQKEGWYHFLPGEYDTLREFLQSIADEESSMTGLRSDALFLAETVLPALENMGVDAEKIISIPTNFSKARAAVPYLRDALDNQTGDQLAETVHAILEGISDQKVTWREFRDSLSKQGHKFANIWGDIYIFPGYNMLVIRTTDISFERYVERRTQGVVEFRGPKDPIELLKEITDQLTGEEEDDNNDN